MTGAAAGTLTFMVGGTENSLAKATKALNCMGKNIVLCGGPGAGGTLLIPYLRSTIHLYFVI